METSNKKNIEESLCRLILNEDKPFVAMLSGEWGIGKTYFWNALLKSALGAKDIVYISLFGQKSLASIESEILAKLYAFNPESIDVSLSLLRPCDFANIVICFDDFERLSDKISLLDVLGLISQFKEQKEAKIILILNEIEISKSFEAYKEKVVDYNFYYAPSQAEVFEALKEDLEKIRFCEANIIYDFFAKIELKNIRMMKQSLYYLAHLDFIQEKPLDRQVINDCVHMALNLFIFKAKSNFDYAKFQKFKQYKERRRLDEVLINTLYEGYLSAYYDIDYLQSNDALEAIIYAFIDRQFMDKEALGKILERNNTYLGKEALRHSLHYLSQRLYFDLNVPLKEDIHSLFSLLKSHKDLIPHILEVHRLKSYFQTIQEHSTSVLSHSFIEEYLLLYEPSKARENAEKGDIGFYLALVERTQGDWHKEDARLLNSLDTQSYQKYILASSVFFYASITLLEKHQYGTAFSTAVRRIKTAFKELRAKSIDKAWKIDRILKEKGISLEDDIIPFDEGM